MWGWEWWVGGRVDVGVAGRHSSRLVPPALHAHPTAASMPLPAPNSSSPLPACSPVDLATSINFSALRYSLGLAPRHTLSGACSTCSDRASGSVKTAVQPMPSFSQARCARRLISPRLAIRTLVTTPSVMAAAAAAPGVAAAARAAAEGLRRLQWQRRLQPGGASWRW